MLTLALLIACTGDAPPPVDEAPSPPPAPARAPAPVPAEQGRSGYHASPTFELVPVEPGAEHRSILLISLDTVRADRLAAYGGPAETPALERLAAHGVRFEQAVTHFPETCLSHWSIMSGVLPELHGNAPAHGGSVYAGPTIAEIAHAAGYSTAAFIGGVTLTDRSCGLARGFDHYDDVFRYDAADMKRPGAEVARLAVDWIGAQRGTWFAFVHFFDAHFPYTPSAPWDTRYDPDYQGTITGRDVDLDPYRRGSATPSERDLQHVLALYDGELSEVDGWMDSVIRAAGEDTVIIVTSDHGESFGHGYWFNHRDALWDGVLRVPLVIAAPGLPAGEVVSPQVGLVDVAPTALGLAGLPHDLRMQGRDLSDPQRSGRPVSWAITDPWRGPSQFSARTTTRKLLVGPRGSEVFDLVRDPGETTPLDEVPPALQGAQEAYREAVEGAAPPSPAPPRRRVSRDEAEQLESLGYVDPTGG